MPDDRQDDVHGCPGRAAWVVTLVVFFYSPHGVICSPFFAPVFACGCGLAPLIMLLGVAQPSYVQGVDARLPDEPGTNNVC